MVEVRRLGVSVVVCQLRGLGYLGLNVFYEFAKGVCLS